MSDKLEKWATRSPTVYIALTRKLGRKPTNVELKAEVQRIIREAYEEQTP